MYKSLKLDSNNLVLYIFPLLILNLFAYKGINGYIFNIITFVFEIYFLSLIFQIGKSGYYFNVLALLMLLYLLSIFSAYIFHDQGIFHSIQALVPIFCLPFYFYLKANKISIENIYSLIFTLLILYCLITIITIFQFPNNIFGTDLIDQTGMLEQRGVLRLGIPGADLVNLAVFYVIVKAKNKKSLYLLLIPLLIFIVLRGTRTTFFITMFLSFIYLLRQYKIVLLFLLVTISILYFNTISTNYFNNSDNILFKFINETIVQFQKNKENEDIRLEMTNYFFSEYNSNLFNDIAGNGIAGSTGTKWGREIEQLSMDKSYYYVDVGYTAIFVYWGYIGLFIYGFLLFKVLKIKINEEHIYLKIFIIYIYLTSFFGAYIYTNGWLLVLSLYMMEQVKRRDLLLKYSLLRNHL